MVCCKAFFQHFTIGIGNWKKWRLYELLNQMVLVKRFYGMGPVIGILTTAEEWIVSWFLVDSDALAHVDLPEASFPTKMKQKSTYINRN